MTNRSPHETILMDMETTTRVPTSVDELWMLVLERRDETPTEEETA